MPHHINSYHNHFRPTNTLSEDTQHETARVDKLREEEEPLSSRKVFAAGLTFILNLITCEQQVTDMMRREISPSRRVNSFSIQLRGGFATFLVFLLIHHLSLTSNAGKRHLCMASTLLLPSCARNASRRCMSKRWSPPLLETRGGFHVHSNLSRVSREGIRTYHHPLLIV
jgi:hypothetical protein